MLIQQGNNRMFPQITVIIPTYNAAKHIETCVEQLIDRCKLTKEIIIVNDASTDETQEILTVIASRFPNVTVLHHHVNQGAGAARNTGFAHATGEYTLFLDDDDMIFDEAIDKLYAEAAATRADFVIAPYMTAPNKNIPPGQMHNEDRKFWDSTIKDHPNTTYYISEKSSVLKTTNYPWNKLCRTTYLRQIDLRFSSTPVHNDIFAHWQIIMNCHTYHVSNVPICIHIVNPIGQNITNIWDKRRLTIFHVLNELDEYFDEKPVLRARYYSQFLSFFTILIEWAKNRMPEDYRAEFAECIILSLSGLNVLDYINYCRFDKSGSERLFRIKFDTYRFAKVENS